MYETEETGEEENTEEEGEVFLLGSKPEQVIREEEKELARPVRRIKNGKERFPFYSVLLLNSLRPGAFLGLLWLSPVMSALPSGLRWKWGVREVEDVAQGYVVSTAEENIQRKWTQESTGQA